MARIIAMDEVGNFELRNQGVRFIGGFVYNTDYELRKKDIEAFLTKLCNEANETIKKSHIDYNVLYPDSLHGSGNVYFREVEENGNNQWQPVPREECKVETEVFKKFIQEKVMEYFKNIKDIKMFVYLDPYTGGGYDDLGENSNITDMSQGSNRYERMALQAIYHKIFYTFDEEPDEYIFEIATRSLPRKNVDENEMYGETNGMMSITNTSTYKTAISTTLYDKGIKSNAKYVFHVAPINYFNSSKYPTTPYTYIADIACTYLREIIQKQFNINLNSTTNLITTEGLFSLTENNKDIEMFVYSEVDAIYRKMVECVKNCELVKYFAYLYELEEMDNITESYKEFYLKEWIAKLNERVKEELIKSDSYMQSFRKVIDENIAMIEGYMGIKEIAYEKGLYIAQKMVELVESQENWQKKNWSLFKLYDVILRGYNHRGSVDRVKEYAKKCDKYKGYINIEEYVSHLLRMVVYYSNGLEYKKALDVAIQLGKIAYNLEANYKLVNKIGDEIAGNIIDKVNPIHTSQMVLIGKIYSNLGQAYAFVNDFTNSKLAFKTALKKFDKSSDNYMITLSYYLHLLIEHNKQEEYEKLAVRYFGKNTLEEQMESAFNYNSYAVLIYIKAFSKFYNKDYANIDILNRFEKKVSGIDFKERNSHPWELIYMHLSESLIFADHNKHTERNYSELALNYGKICWDTYNKKDDSTIILIQLNAQLRYMELSGKVTQDGVLEGFREEQLKNCEKILGLKQPITYRKLKKVLDERITYMYK